jgi:Tfp pilus assembly protein PilV
MSTGRNNSPRGFILAEALVALLIIGVVFLALEGSLKIVLRRIADSEHESVAARIAEAQRERAFASACAPNSGVDSVNAVIVGWTASPDGQLVRVAQTSRYRQTVGDRVEHYDALGTCQ